MKLRKKPLFLSVMVAACVSVVAFLPHFDSSEKDSLLMRTILTVTNSYHYNPVAINDEFSEKVYDLYLERLDGAKRWLIKDDVSRLEAYKYELDDEARKGAYDFLDTAVELVENGIERTQTIYREVLAEPFNFDLEEVVDMDSEKREFAASEEELEEYWRKNLKYEVMTRLTDKLKSAEESEDAADKKDFATLEKEARESVLKLYDDWYDRLSRERRSDYLNRYLDAIAKVYDPHSGYYAPKDKEDFDIRFKGKLEGIGARLSQEGDFTKVVMIVVGGPAWKGKELEEGDVITKVAQGDDGEPLDIKGMRVDDVVQYIRGDKGTKVRLTVKKKDGTIKEIAIIREVVTMEETYAKSLLIENDVQENIGYIYLPGFYADFSDKNGRFCAADVEREIEKLKNDDVQGIILDLRSNGGGSLEEVRKMTGLFIEEGPIVQVKSRGRKPEVLRDVDKSVKYNGPLVVLVNTFSASASEILAAALQDYGRAVIVGSNSTFGKGTVQRFVDLDRMLGGNNSAKPLGQIILTIQKYYRIDGGSVQLRGVTPDIKLPDNYAFIETGERDYDYAMGWSEIQPVRFNQSVYKLNNLEALKAASAARVASDTTFQEIVEHAHWVKDQQDDSEFSLNLEMYKKNREMRKAASKKYQDLLKKEVLTNVSNLSDDLAELENANEAQQERNKKFVKSVQKDIYIKEALNIIKDMETIQ